MAATPNVSNSFVMRLEIPQRVGILAQVINEETKVAAARAIQCIVSEVELGPDYIISSVFDR